MNRQEYNKKILDFLIEKEYICEDSGLCDKLKECIETFPQQRFGQIICNYICWDYRDKTISDFTEKFMNTVFPGNPDPFFEESKYTYYRLTKEIPESYKKELEEKKGKKVYYASGDNTKVGTLEGLVINCVGEWHWVIDGDKISTSKSITVL